MRRRALLVPALALVLASCGGDDEGKSTASDPTDTSTAATTAARTGESTDSTAAPALERPAISTVATNLDIPWELAFLPDGSALITERTGTVRRLTKQLKLAQQPVAEIDVAASGEGGLLGLAIDPHFDRNSFVYVYRTTGGGNEVLRFKYSNRRLRDQRTIVDGLAAGVIHDGGRLRFGPDGALYVTTGESGQSQLAQDPSSLNGKLLRVARPHGAKKRPEIVSSGHRNVQGLDWQPGSHRLYATEFGPDAHDELNLIKQGANYGWPAREGSASGGGSTPALVDWNSVIAPSGATFVRTRGSKWTGDLLVAALRGAQLRRLVFDGSTVKRQETLYEGRFGRLREVVEGPDGALYLLTNNTDGRGVPRAGDDRIVRIEPPR